MFPLPVQSFMENDREFWVIERKKTNLPYAYTFIEVVESWWKLQVRENLLQTSV